MPTASAPQNGHLKTPNHRPSSHFGLFHLFLTRLMARVRALTGRVVQLPPPQPPFHRPSAVLIRYQLSGYLHTSGECIQTCPRSLVHLAIKRHPCNCQWARTHILSSRTQYITRAYGIDTAFAFACIFQCRYQARVLVFTTNITHSVRSIDSLF